MDPIERITMFLTLMRQLQDVIERENAALKVMKIDQLTDLQETKSLLATRYEQDIRTLREQPQVMAGLPDAVRENLMISTRELQDAMRRNAEALNAARTVVEGVVRKLGDSLALVRGGPQGYTAHGRPAEVISVAFNSNI